MQTKLPMLLAFAFLGLRMLRGPRTAVRGNQVAAVGMAIAVGATLAQPGVGEWLLIVIGVAIGVDVGVPAARGRTHFRRRILHPP